ncbi:Alpha/Beta hydrolase protein [Flagelloscypha sp. PMI_526]|nr:Alpha/Beta hydrolase protein [Flagelloscypha sp. PMI_526]
MPHVTLYGNDDFANLYYVTNSPTGTVGSFDPNKGTVILLPPTFLDSSWLHNQMADIRLQAYNLIAFDMRVCGQSSAKPSSKHDSWVEAADLAFCIRALELPPAHILAMEAISVNAALRLVALWPETCVTLTLSNIPSPTELKTSYTAIDELMTSWCFANDIESFEHAAIEAIGAIIGKNIDPDLQDDLIEYWQVHNPPFRRVRTLEMVNVLMNRTPIKKEIFSHIDKPVLIMHGDRNGIYPEKYAQRLANDLSGANDGEGARVFSVKGGDGALNITAAHASIANQTFCKFIARHPTRSELIPPPALTFDRMANALDVLADWMDNPELSQRDPMSSLSFCCLDSQVVSSQEDSLRFYGKGMLDAFSPLAPNGRPWRRWSDRKQEHWFYSDQEGISYAGSKGNREKDDYRPLPVHSMPESEPINPSALVYDGRVRRTGINSTSVEKHVIRGSMTKVLATQQVPAFRMLG